MKSKLLILPLILAACAGNQSRSVDGKETDSVNGDTAAAKAAVVYTLQKVEKKNKSCASAGNNCATFFSEFPLIESAPSQPVKDSITKAINSFILEPVFGDKTATNFDELTQPYFAEFEKEKRHAEGIESGWNVNRVAAVKYNTHSVFSLLFSEDSYVGGAHPNASGYYKNIDVTTGKTLALDDILLPGANSKITLIAEELFRKEKKLTPAASLEDEGYWFKNGKFTLTPNFLIQENGLLFFYNSYEIAPYSMGPTELFIPLDRIKDLVKEEYILN